MDLITETREVIRVGGEVLASKSGGPIDEVGECGRDGALLK